MATFAEFMTLCASGKRAERQADADWIASLAEQTATTHALAAKEILQAANGGTLRGRKLEETLAALISGCTEQGKQPEPELVRAKEKEAAERTGRQRHRAFGRRCNDRREGQGVR